MEEIQILTKNDLDYIREESIIHLSKYSQELKSINDFSFNDNDLNLFNKYIPKDSDFFNKKLIKSIHGKNHITRVMFNIILLNKIMNFNLEPFLIAASYHDVRRENDNLDYDHGVRAAEYIKGMPHLSQTADENLIYSLVRYHNIDYKKIPNDVLNKYKLEIDIFKAADALDRFRQPKSKWFPRVDKIELKESLCLLEICRQSTIITETIFLKDNDYNSIIEYFNNIMKG